MYYFDYHINTIGLYWEWKVTFLKNDMIGFTIREKKIVKRVGEKGQDEKRVEPLQKQTKGVTFFS